MCLTALQFEERPEHRIHPSILTRQEAPHHNLRTDLILREFHFQPRISKSITASYYIRMNRHTQTYIYLYRHTFYTYILLTTSDLAALRRECNITPLSTIPLFDIRRTFNTLSLALLCIFLEILSGLVFISRALLTFYLSIYQSIHPPIHILGVFS